MYKQFTNTQMLVDYGTDVYLANIRLKLFWIRHEGKYKNSVFFKQVIDLK